MTNLERARNGERLMVSKVGGHVIRGIDGENFFVNPDYVDDLINWINQQIDYAVTHVIDDTKEPELWRDLEEGEVYQDGDRVVLHNQQWIIIQKDNYLIGRNRKKGDCLAQRRVRKEDL